MNAPKRLVLVTGASGFLGKHMVRALAANGWAVRAAARDPAAIPEAAGVERVALPDLARDADWAPLVDGATHILHLAGIAHAPGHLPEDVYNRINRDVVGELAGAARGARRALRADVDGQGASRACRRPCHHRSGPAASHRHLRPLQARSRASACRERRSLQRAPPCRGLWTRRQRQYREPRHAGANADAASLRRARQSPLASGDRQPRLGHRACARLAQG